MYSVRLELSTRDGVLRLGHALIGQSIAAAMRRAQHRTSTPDAGRGELTCFFFPAILLLDCLTGKQGKEASRHLFSEAKSASGMNTKV